MASSLLPFLPLLLASSLTLAQATNDTQVNNNVGTHHLASVDYLREESVTSVSRSGILDRVTVSTTSTTNEKEELGICHIGLVLPYTWLGPEGPFRNPFENLNIGGLAAAHLAVDMLNKGDGSIVQEVQDLNQACPMRFTLETLDGFGDPSTTVQATTNVLERQTTKGEKEFCSFIGAVRSLTTIPMSIITGIAQRPQLRYVPGPYRHSGALQLVVSIFSPSSFFFLAVHGPPLLN